MKTPPQQVPHGELVTATEAADLLGIGRSKFHQHLRENRLNLVPVPIFSTESRPVYRRSDVLALVHTKPDTRAERMRRFAHLPELPEGWDRGCID